MHEGPEEPNQFEDFKIKCRRADTRQMKDAATGCQFACPGFDSISCPCLNSIGKSLWREELSHRDYLDTSLGSGNAKLAKYRMTYLRIVSQQPFRLGTFFSNSVSAFSRFTVVKMRGQHLPAIQIKEGGFKTCQGKGSYFCGLVHLGGRGFISPRNQQQQVCIRQFWKLLYIENRGGKTQRDLIHKARGRPGDFNLKHNMVIANNFHFLLQTSLLI